MNNVSENAVSRLRFDRVKFRSDVYDFIKKEVDKTIPDVSDIYSGDFSSFRSSAIEMMGIIRETNRAMEENMVQTFCGILLNLEAEVSRLKKKKK